MKKLISVFLSLAILMTAVLGLEFTASAETNGDWEYTMLNDGTVELTNYIGNNEKITIPSHINGRTVTSIYELTFYDKSTYAPYSFITDIVIPDTITNIDVATFNGCERLKSIIVFSNNNVYCSKDGVLFNKDMTELICYPSALPQENNKYIIPDTVKVIGFAAFIACDLNAVIIPDSVVSIRASAFEGCCSLTSITIPDSVIDIGDSELYGGQDGLVFAGCSLLSEVKLGRNIEKLGNFVFAYCPKLKYIMIPESVRSIGMGCFAYDNQLEYIDVENENISFSTCDGVLFNKDLTVLIQYPCGKKSTSYVVPTKRIEPYAFATDECYLTDIFYPGSDTDMGNNIEIPEQVKINYHYKDINHKGATIRANDAGLRFGFEFYENFDYDYRVEEYGFIYSYPGDIDQIKDIKIEDENVRKKVAENRITTGSVTSFNLVFTNIPKSAYDTYISVKGYVIIDGEYYYSKQLDYNYKFVAERVVNDNQIDDSIKESVKSIINKEV